MGCEGSLCSWGCSQATGAARAAEAAVRREKVLKSIVEMKLWLKSWMWLFDTELEGDWTPIYMPEIQLEIEVLKIDCPHIRSRR